MQGVKYPGYQLLSLGVPFELQAFKPKKDIPQSIKKKLEQRAVGPFYGTKSCLLPSPIDGYIIYAIMAIFSIIWIVTTHYPFSIWRRINKNITYIELENLRKVEENVENQRTNMIWRGDIKGIGRDCLSLSIFIATCFIMQIIGLY